MIESVEYTRAAADAPAAPEPKAKAVPTIEQEEDLPFDGDRRWKLSELEEQHFHRSLSVFKHLTAKNLILACMVGIVLTTALDIWLGGASELVRESFEFFKLLALTTTGYLFGTNKAA